MASRTSLIAAALLLTSALLVTVDSQKQYIFGGWEAPLARYPWQASLQLRCDSSHLCGAIILNERWLVTAAHCTSLFPRFFQIKVGLHSLTKDTPGQPVTHKVDKIVLHPDYSLTGGKYSQDIAMIHTETVIKQTLFTQFAKLPDRKTLVNDTCWVAGWGALYDDSAKTISVGPTDISDGHYIDESTSTRNYIIPDPDDFIPATGKLTEVKVYVRQPGIRFQINILRPTSDPYKYRQASLVGFTPTKAGTQTIKTDIHVQKGDLIGLMHEMHTSPVVPYKFRSLCRRPSLTEGSYNGGLVTFSVPFITPCRSYPLHAKLEITASESDISDTLQHAPVSVTRTTGEQIVAKGEDKGPCQGDDGGALNCNHGEGLQVSGLYSYSGGTCRPEDTDSVYTDLSYHSEWIRKNVE